jgi:hypothetical protein
MPPRPMTAVEKLRFRAFFPGLDVDAALVSGPATPAYNCIAWTVGLTTQWLWPGNTLAHFDTFYRRFGCARCSNGPIAVWGHSPSNMTHGSISGAGHGPRWESKCGSDLRIQHGLLELAGSRYGHVVAYYCRQSALENVFEEAGNRAKEPASSAMKRKTRSSYLSEANKTALQEQTRALPAGLREAFEKAFRAWKETWFRGGLAVDSNPQTRTAGTEYDALIALGPAVLPLVVEKLADPENFLALQLYDALQTEPNLLVHFEPDDERILEGEQGRARRVVQAWFANR